MSIDALIAKADRALTASRDALARGDTETAADRAYYAVYYAAWSLLEQAGMERPKTHNGLISAFSHLYVKSGKLPPELGSTLARLQHLRLVADYTLTPVGASDAGRALAEAERFIARARGFVGSGPEPQ